MSSAAASTTGRTNRSGTPLQGGYQKTVPIDLSEVHDHDGASAPANARIAPAIEREHVHAVYDTIASHWSQTRYKAWPRVAAFLHSLERNALVADLGMGNGKNIHAAAEFPNVGCVVGMDISAPLVRGCAEKVKELKREGSAFGPRGLAEASSRGGAPPDGQQHRAKDGGKEDEEHDPSYFPPLLVEFGVADCVALPLRSGSGIGDGRSSPTGDHHVDEQEPGHGAFDASLLIAVLHHLSTVDRRVAALREAMRVLRKDGLLLVYAWAQEQEQTGVSRHVFDAPDVLVAWHHKGVLPAAKKKKGRGGGGNNQVDDEEDQEASEAERERARVAADILDQGPSHGRIDEEKNAVVYQRYCHVYHEGELESLFRDERLASIAMVEEVWLDTGNWCVRARRI